MTGSLLARAAGIALLFTQAVCRLDADGGALQLHRQAGPFIVSVFTTPPLPRTGPVDFSVLLQSSAALTPVLDAEVEVIARDGRGVTVSRGAVHEQAQNRLLYAAVLTLPHDGEWSYQVTVRRGATAVEAGGTLRVFTESSRLVSHWRALSFPLVLLLLLAVHQGLAAAQNKRGTRRQAVRVS